MSTLQIIQLQSGAFKHVDSIDGRFFLGVFNFKEEFNKAFLVEAYGAKRREYGITSGVIDISIIPFGGAEEFFTNWDVLTNRLVALNYSGIDTNGIMPVGSYLSNDPTTYTNATLPLTGTEVVLLNNGVNWVKITWNNIKAQLAETIITKPSVSGTYNIDYSAGDVWRLTLTGNTTLTESNLPASGKTKTINLQVNGNFSLTYPAGWTGFITGSYTGPATLNTITVQTLGTDRKVQIVQPS
jgi:hypothetical protein